MSRIARYAAVISTFFTVVAPASTVTLPYLAKSANVIVHLGNASRIAIEGESAAGPAITRAVPYQGSIHSAIQTGAQASGGSVYVLVGCDGMCKPNDLTDKLVFLSPVSETDLSYWWKQAPRPPWLTNAYLLVSGVQGAIDVSGAFFYREQRVQEYVNARLTGTTASWAKTVLIENVEDKWLRDSAIDALLELRKDQTEEILQQVILVNPQFRSVLASITLAARYFSERNVETWLRGIALDGNLPPQFRERAVSYFIDDQDLIWRWKQGYDGADAWLSNYATQIWNGRFVPPPPRPVLDLKTLEKWKSDRTREGRLRNLSAAGTYAYSPALDAWLLGVLYDRKAEEAEQQHVAAVDAMGAIRAIDSLRAVLEAATVEEPPRLKAAMILSQLDRKDILRATYPKLPNGTLRNAVAVLMK